MIQSRILYSVSLLLSLLLAMGYGDGSLGFTLLYALLAFGGLCLLTVVSTTLLSLEESLEQAVIFKEESLLYSLSVTNRGWFLYPRVACRLKSPQLAGYGEEWLFPLGPKGVVRREYTLHFPYRGVYPIGVEALVVTDFLGLFRKTIRPGNALVLTVYPKSDENSFLLLQGGPQQTALYTDLFNEDYSSVADVRKYATSDSLRKVHWKLSAKRGELMVKNFNAYQPDRLILLLDTRTLPLPVLAGAALQDTMVGYLAAAADYCMRGSLSAELIYGRGENDRATVGPGDDGAAVFSLLASIPFTAEDSTVHGASRLSGAYNLIVFLALLDQEVHDALRALISFDHNLTLYCFSSPDLPMTPEKEYLLESLKAWGATIHSILPMEEATVDSPIH